jgi:hypothetical protein
MDLFDLDDISDLPFAVKRKDTAAHLIADVLNQSAEPVSIDQVRAAIYRKHGRDINRGTIMNELRKADIRKEVRRVRRGVYAR